MDYDEKALRVWWDASHAEGRLDSSNTPEMVIAQALRESAAQAFEEAAAVHEGDKCSYAQLRGQGLRERAIALRSPQSDKPKVCEKCEGTGLVGYGTYATNCSSCAKPKPSEGGI